MTRSELISKILTNCRHLSQAQVEKSVDLIFDHVIGSLAKGRRVELRGFGTFSLRKREQRMGRNPRTGESVMVANKTVPFFKTGKELRAAVNTIFS